MTPAPEPVECPYCGSAVRVTNRSTYPIATVSALKAEVAALRGALGSLVNAVDDAMESPEEAASWARDGDMNGYIAKARALLGAPATSEDYRGEDGEAVDAAGGA